MAPPARTLVLIPAYGLPGLTHAVAGDLAQERAADVLVVDNEGSYDPRHGEEVLRPGRNLGWLGACNVGLRRLLDGSYEHCVLMNNDVRLSPRFVLGLQEAADAHPGALVAPTYDDDAVPEQYEPHPGGAEFYEPVPEDRDVRLIDGTCVLVPASAAHVVGLLDGRHFGRYGWGAIEDYLLRCRRSGLGLVVTRRAYLSHATGSTASAMRVRYEHFAAAEMHVGLVRKYGRRWADAFPGSRHEVPTRTDLALRFYRHGLTVSGFQGIELRKHLARVRRGAASGGRPG